MTSSPMDLFLELFFKAMLPAALKCVPPHPLSGFTVS